MKFQNCILINFEWTHGGRRNRRAQVQAICPFNFSKVGGKNCILINFERTHGRTDGQKDAKTS